jgi:6-phosphogluconolactonase
LAYKNLRIDQTPQESAKACASFALEKLREALAERPTTTFAISGGTTPKLLFAEFARADFDWSKVHLFWVDERCVPPSDSQSNYRLANETWLRPAQVPAANVHRIRGELTPDEAALAYISEIERTFLLKPGELPRFDLIHRGMGADAHTASLFPGEPLIQNETGIAAAVWVEKLKSHRVTLLPGVLKNARCTIVQLAGADKAEPLANVLNGPEDPMRFPCQIATRGSDQAYWFLDAEAARNVQ